MARFVSYWDASNWLSFVEVMNLQDSAGNYTITAYDRDGTTLWQDTRNLSGHQTDRILLDDQTGGSGEGLVVVEPEKPENEFPSLLTIRGEGQDFKVGNRFVPFIRVT